MAKTVPRAGAVDRRGLVQLGTDCLQPGQQADRVKRHAAPNIDDDHRHHGHDRVAKPVDPRVDDVGMEQHPVEDAERRVEHPLPGKSRQHRRDDERQEDEGAHERLTAEMPVEQECQPQPEGQFEDGGNEGVEAGVPHRDMENVVVPDLDEVVHADEMPGHADSGVSHREQNAVDKGVGDKKREQHYRR